uniref:Ribosomal protein L16 n=1 Tax=Ministeria vibrans TaxID=134558 RepID=M1JF71_MINVI|nr:ribosomal protein L16 [Ministeria vibrans]AGE93713.1 ribosomal protein L16 [Ministeria vibrans]
MNNRRDNKRIILTEERSPEGLKSMKRKKEVLKMVSKENNIIEEKTLIQISKTLKKRLKEISKLDCKVNCKIKATVGLSKKPNESKLGRGKGDIEKYIWYIKKGNLLYIILYKTKEQELLIKSLIKEISYWLPFKIKIEKEKSI